MMIKKINSYLSKSNSLDTVLQSLSHKHSCDVVGLIYAWLPRHQVATG